MSKRVEVDPGSPVTTGLLPEKPEGTPLSTTSSRKRRPAEMEGGASSKAEIGTMQDDMATISALLPPAKKSRTNTPWTPAEEQRLRVMREAGNSWAEIAKVIFTGFV